MKNLEKETGKIILFIIALVFVYSIRGVLTPFILAAILAYILSPLVRFFNTRLHLPHLLSVVFVYVTIVTVLVIIFAKTGILLAKESRELAHEIQRLRYINEKQLSDYPDWARFIILDTVSNKEFINAISPARLWTYFSGAISGIGATFLFLVSGFYFLKDGNIFIKNIKEELSRRSKKNLEELIGKVNGVLDNYLRGQVLLVFLMSSVSWLVLSLLQVKYSLTIGIFTGVAEIIPIIGPIAAGAVAVAVAMFDGVNSLSLDPLMQGLVVAAIYFILRQLEDVFVIPYVLGKSTKLHPLAVLFAVLVGGHLWGIVGMVLAVPIAALTRTVIEYYILKSKS